MIIYFFQSNVIVIKMRFPEHLILSRAHVASCEKQKLVLIQGSKITFPPVSHVRWQHCL